MQVSGRFSFFSADERRRNTKKKRERQIEDEGTGRGLALPISTVSKPTTLVLFRCAHSVG